MSITLEIDFTGICLVVPRPDAGMVSVLIPDASKATNALDGRSMRVHTAALVNHGDNKRRYRLDRTITLGDGGADLASVRGSSFVPLTDIVPNHPVRKDHLRDGANGILCRFDLLAGRMLGPSKSAFWTIAPRLPETRIHDGEFTWTATWRMEGLTPAQIAPLRRLKGLGHDQPIKLADSGTVKLEIANLPPHSHHQPPEPGLPDDDFRWFYQLVADPKGLTAKLSIEDGLPIPVYQSGLPAGFLDDPNTHTCVGGWGDPEP
jgi:hypothetical protein